MTKINPNVKNVIGSFHNEYYELFIVLADTDSDIFVVGDETSWEPLKVYLYFMLTPEEDANLH